MKSKHQSAMSAVMRAIDKARSHFSKFSSKKKTIIGLSLIALFLFFIALMSAVNLQQSRNTTSAEASTNSLSPYIYQAFLLDKQANTDQQVKIRICTIPSIDNPDDRSYENRIRCDEMEDVSVKELIPTLPGNPDEFLSYSVIPLDDGRVSQAFLAANGETVYLNDCTYRTESNELSIDKNQIRDDFISTGCSDIETVELGQKSKSLQRFTYTLNDGTKKIRTLITPDTEANGPETDIRSYTCDFDDGPLCLDRDEFSGSFEQTLAVNPDESTKVRDARDFFRTRYLEALEENGINRELEDIDFEDVFNGIDTNPGVSLKDYSVAIVGEGKRVHLAYTFPELKNRSGGDLTYFIYCPFEDGNPQCNSDEALFDRATFTSNVESFRGIQSFSRFEYIPTPEQVDPPNDTPVPP